MNIQRRLRALASGKSPSIECMKRTYNRAILNGGVIQDFSANVENIREISRKLGYDIIYGRITPRKNLLEFSEEFNNSIWTKTGITLISNFTTNPNGVINATKVSETNVANTDHRIIQAIQVISGNSYTTSIHVRKYTTDINERRYFSFQVSNGTDGLSRTSIIVDTLNGIVTDSVVVNTASPPLTLNYNIVDLGTYLRISIYTVAVSSNGFGIFIAPSNSATPIYSVGTPIYTGGANFYIIIWGVQLEQNSIMTNYQQTNSGGYDNPTAPVPFLYVPSSYGEGKNFTEVQNKRNLLQWSEDFSNAYWTKQASTTLNNVTIAPDGNLSADKIYPTSDLNNCRLQLLGLSITPNITYTVSFYVKKAELNYVSIRQSDGVSTNQGFMLNLNNGQITVGFFDGINSMIFPPNYSARLINDNWIQVRYSFIFTTSTMNLMLYLADSSTTTALPIGSAASNKGIYIWGYQLEIGAYATPYQKTVAVGNNIVDFIVTRATTSTVTNKQGIVEDSCYNLAPQSEGFSTGTWTKQGAVTPNAAISPIGTNTASKLTEAASTTNHYCYQASLNVPKGFITFSCYLKKAERNVAQLLFANAGTGVHITIQSFNLENGTLSGVTQSTGTNTDGSASITDAGNGWWLCSITGNIQFSTTYAVYIKPGIGQYLGTAGFGIYAWGAQLVQGSVRRPYLKTTSRTGVPKLNYRNFIYPNKNLLLYSEDFTNPIWIKGNSTINTNANTLSPNNGNSYFLNEGSSNNNHYISQDPIVPKSGVTYTISWYVKKADHTWIQLTIGASFIGTDRWRNFNFDTGLFGNGLGIFVAQALDNGWWLITTVAIGNGVSASSNLVIGTNNTDSAIRIPTYVGTNKNIAVISIMQLETGSTATSYQSTTLISTKPSLLLEPTRLNYIVRSQEIDNASIWGSDPPVVVRIADATIAPNGTLTADKITENTSAAFQDVYQLQVAPANNRYTFSVYLKAGERNLAAFSVLSQSGIDGATTILDLNTGTLVTDIKLIGNATLPSTLITNAGNGWWRCSITANLPATITSAGGSISIRKTIDYLTYAGTAGYGIYIWGAQLEIGSNPTSYIPTVAGQITRNSEQNYIDLWNNGMLNRNNFTLYWEGYLYDGGQTTGFGAVALSDTSAANSTTNQVGWYYVMRPYQHIGGVGLTSFNGGVPNSFNKFAIQYNNGIANYYANGINIFPNRSIPVFDYRYLVINSNTVGATYSTDKIALFNRTLTNAELTGLTNNPNINTGISAFYKLDGNTIDSSSNCPSGTSTSITYTTGKTGNAAVFNTSSRIDISDIDYLSFSESPGQDIPFSISVWAFFTGFSTVGNWFINKRDSNININEWQLIYSVTNGNVIQINKFDSVNNNISLRSNAGLISLNTWYHIVYTDAGLNTPSTGKLYLNGVQVTLNNFSLGVYSGMTNTTTIASIGNLGGGFGTSTAHQGLMEDIGIWKYRVLTQDDITNLYNLGSGRTYPF